MARNERPYGPTSAFRLNFCSEAVSLLPLLGHGLPHEMACSDLHQTPGLSTEIVFSSCSKAQRVPSGDYERGKADLPALCKWYR